MPIVRDPPVERVLREVLREELDDIWAEEAVNSRSLLFLR